MHHANFKYIEIQHNREEPLPFVISYLPDFELNLANGGKFNAQCAPSRPECIATVDYGPMSNWYLETMLTLQQGPSNLKLITREYFLVLPPILTLALSANLN